ncbi:hypothetical protein EPA93_25900 [Ktedonosporobacter rubrisoli]|uniref:DUF4386 family protein n=1 Tax=Ktedonosporobacter rubrisoli TaxID=2509675 RepID=A0A4P6JUC3_KTERU|nr:hypothetical protein [Ktedonosporobacter rubrisoli]QBD79229.1 hypothetical protein EPA93_25900 [Ktedonosporobacter rubrisoli]
MKRSLLSRLRTNGAYYIVSALLLLLGVPLYQFFVLTPQGYNIALSQANVDHFAPYLSWISNHSLQFILYRGLLTLAFVLLFTFPFSLYRIIVAQELMAQEEEAEQADEGEDDEQTDNALDGDEEEAEAEEEEQAADDEGNENVLPPHPWRGKGFAVLAAWAGIFGISAYVLGTIASTLHVLIVSRGFTPGSAVPGSFATLTTIFSIITNTVGTGLLALSALFFGVMIARRGMRLWPGIWVVFSYVGMLVAALGCGSAVAVASTPTGQSLLTTPATICFALWALWLGIMQVRLKPE